MKYIRKTRDVYEVEANYGYGHGWESVTAEETYGAARERIREYRENMPEYPYRLKVRRERIEVSA